MRIRYFAILPAVLVSFSGAAEAKTLTAAEIQSQIIGKKLCITQFDVCVRHNANGTSEYLKGGDDAGTWRLDGNKLCTKWKKARKGKEGCITFNLDGDLYSYTSGGNDRKLTVE